MEKKREEEDQVDKLASDLDNLEIEKAVKEAPHFRQYEQFRSFCEKIVKIRGVVPALIKKEDRHTLGVTRFIDNYAKNKTPWKFCMDKGDFETVFRINFSTSSAMNTAHNTFSGITRMMSRLSLDVLDHELAVCSTNLVLPIKPGAPNLSVPIGSIDMVCYDRESECYVLCDIKTSDTGKGNFEDYVLKQTHAIQLSLYTKIFESMATESGNAINVGYMMIFGFDMANGRLGAWKIHRNDSKWLSAEGLQTRWCPFF